MKKKYLLTLPALFTFLISFSQNPVSRENYFKIGFAYFSHIIYELDTNTLLQSGNDVIWDFTGLAFSGNDKITALDPSQTPFYNDPNVNYNTTELCLNSLNGNSGYDENMYSYFHSSDQEIAFAGEWADNSTWEYYFYQFEDPEKYYAFPFSYGQSFTDEYLSSGLDKSGSGWHKGWGTRNVTADGTGVLIMPDKTYSNCLRVKAIVNQTDSCHVFGVRHYMKYHYTWFDATVNGPVLDVEVGSNMYVIKARYYYNNPPVSTSDLDYSKIIKLSPNPVTDKLQVEFNQPVSGNVDYTIYNMTGEPLISSGTSNATSFQISVKTLPTGVYYLKTVSKEGIAVRKFIKQ